MRGTPARSSIARDRRQRRRRSSRCPPDSPSRRSSSSAWRFWLTLLIERDVLGQRRRRQAGERLGRGRPRRRRSLADLGIVGGAKRAVADARPSPSTRTPRASSSAAKPPGRIMRRIVDAEAQAVSGSAPAAIVPVSRSTPLARQPVEAPARSRPPPPSPRDCRPRNRAASSSLGGSPDRAGRDRAPAARCRRASAPRCAVPERVGMLFQLIPGLQRWSGNRLSSPITSRTRRVRAATASASAARQFVDAVRRARQPRVAMAVEHDVGRSARPARAAPPRRPAASGWSSPGSVAKAAAVVNILVFDAGMKRLSGSIAIISRPSSSRRPGRSACRARPRRSLGSTRCPGRPFLRGRRRRDSRPSSQSEPHARSRLRARAGAQAQLGGEGL